MAHPTQRHISECSTPTVLFARLSLSPITGRKHQLRVHCAALRMPIVNDHFYPELQPACTDNYERPLQLLATSIASQDPITGQAREFATTRQLLRTQPT
jgi:tRNA pseudouridine32 synthase / 23S rRNA pseudouridine746 synthase